MKHRRPRAAQNKDVVPLIADQVFQPAVVHAPRRPAPKRKSLNKKAPKRAKAKTVVKRARGSGNRGGSKKGGGRKSAAATALDANKLVQEKFKPRPTTQAEMRHCSARLSAAELAQLFDNPAA